MRFLIKLIFIYCIIVLIQSCSVSTKSKKHTVALLKCQDRELVDKRKKYSKREKQLERRNARKLRKIDNVK